MGLIEIMIESAASSVQPFPLAYNDHCPKHTKSTEIILSSGDI